MQREVRHGDSRRQQIIEMISDGYEETHVAHFYGFTENQLRSFMLPTHDFAALDAYHQAIARGTMVRQLWAEGEGVPW